MNSDEHSVSHSREAREITAQAVEVPMDSRRPGEWLASPTSPSTGWT